MSHDVALMAATEWAQAFRVRFTDPVEFGVKVASAYRACQAAVYHAGDERATAAALAALSVRPEVLQATAQLSLSFPPSPAASTTTKLQALKWAQGFTESDSLDQLLAGALACEAFLDEAQRLVGLGSPQAWAALSAAASIAMRSDADPSWTSIIDDAREVLMHLCRATALAHSLPREAALNPPGVE